MKDIYQRVIEAAVEFRLVYGNPEWEGDDTLCDAVDDLLHAEPRRWTPPGARDHMELDRA